MKKNSSKTISNTIVKIYEYIKKNKTITTHELVNNFRISRQMIIRHLNKLIDEEKIYKEGPTRNSKYSLLGKNKNIVQKFSSIIKLKNLDNVEDFEFDKTVFTIKFSPEHRCIARSEAKRVLFGLDKFKRIVLDFKNVNEVGQGFLDEIFRVFQNQHPTIQFEYINTKPHVLFMIKRAI